MAMDHLSKALANTRLRGSLLATLDFAAPWFVDFETAPAGSPAHYIVSGEAWLEHPGEEPLHLASGDLVMFPRWDPHFLRSKGASGQPVSIRDVVSRNNAPVWVPGDWLDGPIHLLLPGEGDHTRLLSMVFDLEETGPHALLLGLPRFIHLAADANETGSLLKTTLDFLAAESVHRRDGYTVVSSRLADLVFMQIVRDQLLRQPDQVAGWLRALVDPAIGEAIAAIHDNPAAPWTLNAMARASGLSRSGFCARFKDLTGTPPSQYLRSLKMTMAAERLAAGVRIKQLATELGYATPYAFGSAFKQHFGILPSHYRQSKLQ